MSKLTKKDMRTLRSALNNAMDERDSFADAYSYQGPEAERALQLVRDYEALHVKIFGEPSGRAREIARMKTIPSVSILKLGKKP